MERVRAFDVALEGFRLVRRQPKIVFVWGALLTLVQTFVPLLCLGWMLASQDGLWSVLVNAESGAESEALSAFELQMNLIQLGLLPFVLVLSTVLAAAAYRAVLEPEARASFYLRLSRAEGWLLLVGIVAMIVIGVPTVIVCLIVAAAIGAATMVSTTVAVVVGILLGGAAIAAYVWVGAHFILAGPMTFVARDFRLFESWTLVKGRVWLVVRVWLALFVLVFGAALALILASTILILALVFAIVVPLANGAQGISSDVWFSQNLSLVIGLGSVAGLAYLAISAFLSGAYVAVLSAPFARLLQIFTAESLDGDAEASASPGDAEATAQGL